MTRQQWQMQWRRTLRFGCEVEYWTTCARLGRQNCVRLDVDGVLGVRREVVQYERRL